MWALDEFYSLRGLQLKQTETKILALILSEISAFIRTDIQTDMARSTRLVILVKNVICFMGSISLLSTCYILSDESSIPFYSTSNGYNQLQARA